MTCIRALAIKPSGGARRDRTDDLMLAKHALSQLSYGPISGRPRKGDAPNGPKVRKADPRIKPEGPRRLPAEASGDGRRRRRLRPSYGGPGTTRTSDLTLIRGAL